MKRRIISSILVLVMLIGIMPTFSIANAATSGTTGSCTWSLNGTVLTISGNGKMANYSSGGPWGKSITKVIIEKGVTSIGNYAFYSCKSLTMVEISDSVASIESSAFSNCSSLTSIEIPDSVTSIKSQTFYSCTSLTNVVIPNSVTSIGFQAFYNCSSLTEIFISAFVTSADEYIFSNCDSLMNVTVDPKNQYYCSQDGVFFNKKKTTLIHFPSGRTGTYVVPDSVTLIEESAFENSNLTNVVLGSSVKTINSFAFSYSKKLTNIVMHESVNDIYLAAFINCTSLKNVYYTGTKTEKSKIYVEVLEEFQNTLENVTWQYNCVVFDGHVFDDDLDSTCNICDYIKQCTKHAYVDDCDYDCNICGYTRTPPHSYTTKYNATYHWKLCTACKNTANKHVHIYDNASDTKCNTCSFVRQIPQHTYDNDYDKTCNDCGQERYVKTPEIVSVSVVLGNSLAYKIKASGIADSADAKVIFTVGDKTYTVKNHTMQDDLLVFTIKNIAPHLMTEEITAKLVVSMDGKELYIKEYTTTLEEYCLAVVQSDSSYKEIVNSVLNYGAAAQSYKNYKTDALANKTLTGAEKEIIKNDYFNGLDKEYFKAANSTVNWKSAGLYLDTKANIKLGFETTEQDLDGVSVLVETEWFDQVAVLENCIIKENGKYVFYFSDFNIDELDTIFLFTLCKDGKPISDTLSYSVESYAYRADSTNDSNLKNLMSALMNYGAVAKNY